MEHSSRSLAGLWAQKYVEGLLDYAWEGQGVTDRDQIAELLLDTLRFASSQAWSKTESLLSTEVRRHQIDRDLIDPWQIADDSRYLFVQAMESYRSQFTPELFATQISPFCGQIRQRYTAHDPRILGFMSMQFHYTGQLLLDRLTPQQQLPLLTYLKVMDDHLYMPLDRAYQAAGDRAYTDPILTLVRQVLPLTTPIAHQICEQVAQEFPQHRCHSGSLGDPQVRISGVRDVEMFQVYLCLCVLEGSIHAVQQELFPLCVMLYPPLQVSWPLIRRMLQLLEHQYRQQISAAAMADLHPYLQDLTQMFSTQVLA